MNAHPTDSLPAYVLGAEPRRSDNGHLAAATVRAEAGYAPR